MGKNRDGHCIGKNRDGYRLGKNRDGQRIGKNRDGHRIGKNRDGHRIGKNIDGHRIGNLIIIIAYLISMIFIFAKNNILLKIRYTDIRELLYHDFMFKFSLQFNIY